MTSPTVASSRGQLVGRATWCSVVQPHFTNEEENDSPNFNQFYRKDVWLFNEPCYGLTVPASPTFTWKPSPPLCLNLESGLYG